MVEYFRLVRQFALGLFALGLLGLVALSLPAFLKWSLLAILVAACVGVRAQQKWSNKHGQRLRHNDDLVVMPGPTPNLLSQHQLGPSHQSVTYVQASMALLRERELWIEKMWRIANMSVSRGMAGGG
jgi:hypothetical protein